MAKSISSRTIILAALATMPGLVHSQPAPVGQEAQTAALDSIEQSLDAVEGQARRSLFGGGSKPVSFSGEALMRFIGTSFDEYPSWMSKDATETKNSLAAVRVSMVVAPQRNLRLWSKIAFNHSFMGNNSPADATFGGGYRQTPQTAYYDPHSSNLYEDMAAGLMAKTGPVTTHARIGGVLWTEASPLTLWKGQNRMFGWDYVPYELEQSSAQYWEYATIKGEKTGRAAWNKKPFQGINLESIEMPWNLYYTLTYGSFEGYQKFQPYYINTSNTNGLQYTDEASTGLRSFATKGLGIGDGFRKATTFRVAKAELPGAVTVGLNYLNYKADNDYAKQWLWASHWGGLSDADSRPIKAVYRNITSKIVTDVGTGLSSTVFDTTLKYKSNYFISHSVGSMDARRTLPGGLQFHVDVAMSQTDTAYFKVNDSGKGNYRQYRDGFDSAYVANTPYLQVLGHKTSAITPAVYVTVSYPSKFAQFDLSGIWAPKDFYSGTSFVMPLDAFFPFESNLLGAGKFAGTDGGTPYASNMTGANLITKIPVSGGHMRLSTGYHKQLENGRDLIYIPWRLNGTAFKYSQNASTTQYDGAGLEDDYLRGNPAYEDAVTEANTPSQFRQVRRLGDDFYAFPNPDKNTWAQGTLRRNAYAPTSGEAGGIRGDFMATFENFGMFRMRQVTAAEKATGDSALLKARQAQYTADSMGIVNMGIYGKMPQTTKSTQNLALDVSYDVARLWSGKRALFLGFYGALNSVTKNGTVIPTLSDDDNTFVRGSLLRFEPVVQLSQGFYLIGLVGRETWKSPYGVALIDTATGLQPVDRNFTLPKNWVAAPIDYTDLMFGLGFDWDMAPRVGLHMRLQRFSHEDKGISAVATAAKGKNDYKAWLLHAETKMWF